MSNIFLILSGSVGDNKVAINVDCISSIVSTGNPNERTTIFYTEGSMSRKATTSQSFDEIMHVIEGE